MASQPLIEIRGLSKRYTLGQRRAAYDSLREALVHALRGTQRATKSGEFWALREVSFDVHQGDIVGILGANGAGKTTLLKIISRITDPTAGTIRMRGRVASLLEVGTGFHPELTGRENIYLNGAILGMRKREIENRMEEIIAFSGIDSFIDTPVKRYSSGMYVRLAFSVAAHLEPDILIADEVLAVGDAAFQKKCLGKMAEARARARSVLFVSHNLVALENLCNRGVVLQKGAVVFLGTARDAIQFYLQGTAAESAAGTHVFDLSVAPGRMPSYPPLLRRLELSTTDNQPATDGVRAGGPLRAAIRFHLPAINESFDVWIGFHTVSGQLICSANSAYEKRRVHEKRGGEQVFVCDIPSLPLLPGEYTLHVALLVAGHEVDYVADAARLTVTYADFYGTGAMPGKGAFLLQNHWRLEPD